MKKLISLTLAATLILSSTTTAFAGKKADQEAWDSMWANSTTTRATTPVIINGEETGQYSGVFVPSPLFQGNEIAKRLAEKDPKRFSNLSNGSINKTWKTTLRGYEGEDTVVTRLEVAEYLVGMASLATNKEFTVKRAAFKDTKNSVVLTAAAYGFMKGDKANKFNPNDKLTRAEFASTINNLSSYLNTTFKLNKFSSAKETATFADVTTKNWFMSQVATAEANNAMKGVSANKFNPNGLVTDAELVKAIDNVLVQYCAKYNEERVSEVSKVITNSKYVLTEKEINEVVNRTIDISGFAYAYNYTGVKTFQPETGSYVYIVDDYKGNVNVEQIANAIDYLTDGMYSDSKYSAQIRKDITEYFATAKQIQIKNTDKSRFVTEESSKLFKTIFAKSFDKTYGNYRVSLDYFDGYASSPFKTTVVVEGSRNYEDQQFYVQYVR